MPDKLLFVDPCQPVPKNVIDRIILAAAPEKESEWRALCARYKPCFHLVPDSKGLTLRVRGNTIEFDSKTMGWIWLLGFAAWRAFVIYGPHLFLRWLTGAKIDENLRAADRGYSEARTAFESILYVTRDLAQMETLDEAEDWPEGVPARQADKSGFDIEQQATFDLIIIATAYALLHEIRHVIFNAEGARPSRPEEEIVCDAFAREFILNGAEKYSNAQKYALEQVLMKRAAGIALGAYVIYKFTDPQVRAGTTDYPPIADRLDGLIAKLPPDDQNPFWDFAACLLMAILYRRGRLASIPDLLGRALCMALIDVLRKSDS